MNDSLKKQANVGHAASPLWAGLLVAVVMIVIVAVAFFGYGQPALLLDAVNLRYCG